MVKDCCCPIARMCRVASVSSVSCYCTGCRWSWPLERSETWRRRWSCHVHGCVTSPFTSICCCCPPPTHWCCTRAVPRPGSDWPSAPNGCTRPTWPAGPWFSPSSRPCISARGWSSSRPPTASSLSGSHSRRPLSAASRERVWPYSSSWLLPSSSTGTCSGHLHYFRKVSFSNYFITVIITHRISGKGNAIGRVCLFVSTLSFEQTDFWTWVCVCVWLITIARLRLKVKVIRQD